MDSANSSMASSLKLSSGLIGIDFNFINLQIDYVAHYFICIDITG
jgi:hypothetical protein